MIQLETIDLRSLLLSRKKKGGGGEEEKGRRRRKRTSFIDKIRHTIKPSAQKAENSTKKW
jgi:uncharacterized protein YnzC (UPF0291/DUF896 family)